MTTFTLQDLTPEQQVAVDKHQEMHRMFQQMGQDLTPQPTITKEEFMEYGMNNPLNISPTTQDILNNMAVPHAPEPQPSEIDPMALIEEMMSQFSIKLKLLATVISQSKAQPEKGTNVPPDTSLQECLSLTLQQADWFKDLIRHELVALDIAEIAKDAVEDIVENEVESYFSNQFDPEQHFDFGDAVSNEVDDRLEDIVRDKVGDVIDEVVAEKLSEASVSISFN
jgi:hypothetical protein